MEERRRGERRKTDRRADLGAAKRYLGMERRLMERRTDERRRARTSQG